MTSIVWIKDDFRLFDNPALYEGVKNQESCCLVFIDFYESAHNIRRLGAASKWWLRESLSSFQKNIEHFGGKLLIQKGNPQVILPRLAEEIKAQKIFWNRSYNPEIKALERSVEKELLKKYPAIEIKSFKGQVLFEPGEIKNTSGTSFQVFTPFWKKCREKIPSMRDEPPFPVPKSISSILPIPSLEVNDLDLYSTKTDWAKDFPMSWQPGERGAQDRLKHFLDHELNDYKTNRDFPSIHGTSRLSPHLHFGEISLGTIVKSCLQYRAAAEFGGNSSLLLHIDCFLSELGWREFSYHLLSENPKLSHEPLQKKFKSMPWENDNEHFDAWKKGRTGYPIIDAGMRELWQTGWMHNRVRMIVASFLIKDLFVDWRQGEEWFWDTLVDADAASNAASWQWVAGCGADAAPYFRIFNPVLQSKKFDPEGHYIRRFVPELKNVPIAFIHAPWEASPAVLKNAGVFLGNTYPKPIVDHGVCRKKALEFYAVIKNA